LRDDNEENPMTRTVAIRCVGCAVVTLFAVGPIASSQSLAPDAHGFLIAHPEDLKPAGGGRSITIVGDSSKPGMYVTRITWAPGSGSRPHYHDQARYITVLKGTWWVATGPDADVYNPDKMTPVRAGSFIYEPPGGHHYDMAKDEEAVVEIIGMGPVGTTSLEPGRGRQGR
jgi:quercetin dioxygenase-like cupin family protein